MDRNRFRTAERRLWDSFGVTPTERRIHLDHCDVTVRVQELGDGPTVLLVHGGSNGGSSWAPLVARLNGFRCVLLDRPGCGLSDPVDPRPCTITAIAAYADRLIPDVLDALGSSSSHVVATSFGGYFALRAAFAHPERVGRIVEFGWTVGAPMEKVPFAMRVTSIPALGWAMARVPPNERAVRMLLRQIGVGHALDSGQFTQEAVDWYLALLRDTPTLRNELAATPRVILPIKGLNEEVLLSESLLARIAAPVQFVWGTEDPNGGEAIARSFVRLLPNAELKLMPGVGHAPWMDDPDDAASATRNFLATDANMHAIRHPKRLQRPRTGSRTPRVHTEVAATNREALKRIQHAHGFCRPRTYVWRHERAPGCAIETAPQRAIWPMANVPPPTHSGKGRALRGTT